MSNARPDPLRGFRGVWEGEPEDRFGAAVAAQYRAFARVHAHVESPEARLRVALAKREAWFRQVLSGVSH